MLNMCACLVVVDVVNAVLDPSIFFFGAFVNVVEDFFV